jgi:hypothetical protein
VQNAVYCLVLPYQYMVAGDFNCLWSLVFFGRLCNPHHSIMLALANYSVLLVLVKTIFLLLVKWRFIMLKRLVFP